MRLIFTSLAVCGALALAGCGTASSILEPAPPILQSADPEPAPVRSGSRPPRAAVATSATDPADGKLLDYNSPAWKEREKRRDEELGRKINSICRGC